jgi:hypothetical protein
MPIDYSKYPKNWKTEIVPRIRKRSGNKCEKCGIPNSSIIFSVPIYVRTGSKRYGPRAIWFSSHSDAARLDAIRIGEIKQVKVVLTVAHMDHDEHNHEVSDDRLAHWCQKCHLEYDSEEKMRRIIKKSGLNVRKNN